MYSPETLRAMNARIVKQIATDKAHKEQVLERAKQRGPATMPAGFVSAWRPKSERVEA